MDRGDEVGATAGLEGVEEGLEVSGTVAPVGDAAIEAIEDLSFGVEVSKAKAKGIFVGLGDRLDGIDGKDPLFSAHAAGVIEHD